MAASNQKSPVANPKFLLQNSFAEKLYFNYAENLPIIDYHNHLSPGMIASNHQFSNLTKAWLDGDHYKWRAMRNLGFREKYISGDASDEEKFSKWAATVPHTLRNPLFHWTHLELSRYFEVDYLLTPDSAPAIYEQASTRLQEPTHGAVGLLEQMNVEVVCTTDDPLDDLKYHQAFRHHDSKLKLLPTFRPDRAYNTADPVAYSQYLQELENTSGIALNSFDDLLDALLKRVDYFHRNHCQLADHGLTHMPSSESGAMDADAIFKKLWNQKPISPQEADYYCAEILKTLCRAYHKHGWVQQFHLGAARNVNRAKVRELGPDTGFDSIGDFRQIPALGNFLSELEETGSLAKTIIYNLNPADNAAFATMAGNFSREGVKGHVQWGSAWWFLDQKEGMEDQLNTLSQMGLLSSFVGMLTDSRSFLSFPRHEYFRRILCNLIGQDVAAGLLPKDEKWLGQLVADICYHNAKNYFNFQ